MAGRGGDSNVCIDQLTPSRYTAMYCGFFPLTARMLGSRPASRFPYTARMLGSYPASRSPYTARMLGSRPASRLPCTARMLGNPVSLYGADTGCLPSIPVPDSQYRRDAGGIPSIRTSGCWVTTQQPLGILQHLHSEVSAKRVGDPGRTICIGEQSVLVSLEVAHHLDFAHSLVTHRRTLFGA